MKKAPSLAKSTGVVSAVTLASRVLGMFRDMVIASIFGAGLISDAFFLAFTIPNLLRRLVAEGSLATAFVPVFTDSIEHSEEAARKTIKEVSGFSILLTGALTVLGVIFAPELTDFFAPGFASSDEQRELTIGLTRIMMPYVIIISLIALGAGALNTIGLFAVPATAPAILNVFMISSLLLFHTQFKQPVYALAYSVPIGGLAALLCQNILLGRRGLPMRLANPFGSKAVKTIAFLMLPSIVASSVYQIMVLVNRMLASMLSDGSISWYYFADRLVQFPLGVFSIALATAILPQLSRLASRKEHQQFDTQLLTGLNWVSFIILPASAGLIFLAEPLVKSIYGYGKFSGGDIPNTANALVAFSLGLWSVSAHAVLVRAFLAKKNTAIPAAISSMTITANIFLAIAFMGEPLSTPNTWMAQSITAIQAKCEILSMGHIGLALAGSVASLFNFLILSTQLKRINCSFNWKGFAISTLRSAFCTACMCVALYLLKLLPLPHLIILVIGVFFGGLSYFLCAKLLKCPELEQTMSIIGKVKERSKK